MTTWIERARTRTPVTWATVIGVVLLPAIIGGLLLAALYNPTERLDLMHAAIVNDDEPVTLDGQYIPLGRQLTAGLVEGAADQPNVDWTISNSEDAAAGLADGTYTAVVTVPANFSAAATSPGAGTDPTQATIEVVTAPDALVIDDAITAQITAAATAALGQQLSETYLENVLLGFTTIGDNIGKAADGADTWAKGADTSADGAGDLADGLGDLSSGATEIANGMSQTSTGAGQVADGAGALSNGARQAADGLTAWAAGAREAATSSGTLADGLRQIADQTGVLAGGLSQLAQGARAGADASAQVASGAGTSAQALTALATGCSQQGGTAEYCAQLAAVAEGLNATATGAAGVAAATAQVADGLAPVAESVPALTSGITQSADGAGALRDGLGQLADGADQAAGGVNSLSAGAGSLADGARELAGGAQSLASGTSQWADGANDAADGGAQLADGVTQLADGSRSLADGLHQAADAIPSYTDTQAQDLAAVVADPVTATTADAGLFSDSTVPLLATVILWFGSLATFIVVRAIPSRALTSRRSSAELAGAALLPAVVIGAVQGLLVSILVQVFTGYDAGTWWGFASMCVAVGISFAFVQQALAAVGGGFGRGIAALIGVLAFATGIVSTVPGFITGLAAAMPTAPAYNGLLAAISPATGGGAAIAGLVIWAGLSFLATVLVVARQRRTTPHAVLSGAVLT